MQQREYRPRVIDAMVEEYLETFGAVCIEGPKWCGKTWTAEHHSNSQFYLADPNQNFQNRALAELDLGYALHGKFPRLIDEWQELPRIWDAVRGEVDSLGRRGLYILTGSATVNRSQIIHSGAGRFGRLRMRPMSLYESGDSSGKVSLRELCETPDMKVIRTGEVNLLNLAGLIVRGGWPGVIGMSEGQASLLSREYLKAVISDDVFKLDGIRRETRKMELLLRALARNESTMVSNSKLCADMSSELGKPLDGNTVAAYLDVFRRLYLTDDQPPFAISMRSSARVRQAEKRHFADPSLACALLNATSQSLIGDINTMGFLFEALVERDLRIYAESFGAKMYHYRDSYDHEIDAVIELGDGNWCAFEIKLGAHQIDKAAADLLKMQELFKKNSAKPPKLLCVICGMSSAAYRRPDGVYVVPITALKN